MARFNMIFRNLPPKMKPSVRSRTAASSSAVRRATNTRRPRADDQRTRPNHLRSHDQMDLEGRQVCGPQVRDQDRQAWL
jgi:hypothetical protein